MSFNKRITGQLYFNFQGSTKDRRQRVVSVRFCSRNTRGEYFDQNAAPVTEIEPEVEDDTADVSPVSSETVDSESLERKATSPAAIAPVDTQVAETLINTVSPGKTCRSISTSSYLHNQWQEGSRYKFQGKLYIDATALKVQSMIMANWEIFMTYKGPISDDGFEIWQANHRIESNVVKLTPMNFNKNVHTLRL